MTRVKREADVPPPRPMDAGCAAAVCATDAALCAAKAAGRNAVREAVGKALDAGCTAA